jgi:hypothetical protein
MYETFGAVVTQKKVEFKLFFPDRAVAPAQYDRGGLPRIKEIRVRGDFQGKIGGKNWDFDSAPVMTKGPHPKGWLYTYKIDQDLADGFYQYKFSIMSIAGGRERWFKTQPSAIALLTAPGTVMIHNGQEFGEDYFLPESGPDRVQSRPLRWEDHGTDFAGQRICSNWGRIYYRKG